MLFDPKWEKCPTLRQFIAWLRTKPADESYDWCNVEACACAQFWGATWGFKNFEVREKEGADLNSLAYGDLIPGVPMREQHTFGQLLARAERKLEELVSAN